MDPTGDTPRDERWIPLAVAVLALVLTGLGLWHAEHDALHDPVKHGERGLVVGASGKSLLRAANLRRAFAVIAADLRDGEVVTDIYLAPTQARVSVRDAEAHQRDLAVDLAYELHRSAAGINPGDGPTLARVDSGAPERLVTAALARGHYSPRSIVDLDWTYEAGSESQSWDLTLRDVPIADQRWVADGTAAHIRRASDPEPDPATPSPEVTDATTPTAPAKPATRKPGRKHTTVRLPPHSNVTVVQVGGTTVLTSPAEARRLRACLRRVRTAAAIQRCVTTLGRG